MGGTYGMNISYEYYEYLVMNIQVLACLVLHCFTIQPQNVVGGRNSFLLYSEESETQKQGASLCSTVSLSKPPLMPP